MSKKQTVLKIEDLKVCFPRYSGIFIKKNLGNINAVDGVSLTLKRGESLGIAGESGCGKSTLAKTILRLINSSDGRIYYKENNITQLPEKKLKKHRAQLQVVFQDPYASLNPRMTVYDILAEPLLEHKIVPKNEIQKKINKLMNLVGLSPKLIRKYPHEFSGGQRQRVAIARALSPNPEILIADEPVSALDVSIQAQILNLIKEIQQNMNFSLLFISHNLAVIRYICNRVAIMYAGKILETGNTDSIFSNPKHPYTKSLLKAIPVIPSNFKNRKSLLLYSKTTKSLRPTKTFPGCIYYDRCPNQKSSLCSTQQPQLNKSTPDNSEHYVACYNP